MFQGIPATGRHIAVESAEVFGVADGKFVGYWCMVEAASLARSHRGANGPGVINHADPAHIVSGFGSFTASSIDGVAPGEVVRMPDPRCQQR